MSFRKFGFPQNDSKYLWTSHIIGKMRYYGISEQQVKKIVRMPERKEDGIAPKTIAVMNTAKSKTKPHEIWVMYQTLKSKTSSQNAKTVLISAWRYPGRSPIGKKIDIPENVLMDLQKFLHSN